MSSPKFNHWVALKQILCYLKKALGISILYRNHGHNHIECYSDADWASSKIKDPLRAIVYSLEETWSRGGVRNKMLYLDQVQHQSTKLWHNLCVK